MALITPVRRCQVPGNSNRLYFQLSSLCNTQTVFFFSRFFWVCTITPRHLAKSGLQVQGSFALDTWHNSNSQWKIQNQGPSSPATCQLLELLGPKGSLCCPFKLLHSWDIHICTRPSCSRVVRLHLLHSSQLPLFQTW